MLDFLEKVIRLLVQKFSFRSVSDVLLFKECTNDEPKKKKKVADLSIQKANLFINFLEKMTTHALFLFDWHFSSVTSIFNLSDDMLEITST